MTMTWRERIAAARERGSFSQEDHDMWDQPSMCFVGEQRARYGLWFNLEMTGFGFIPCDTLQLSILRAMRENDFHEAERLLDHVEDRALELKRVGGLEW